MKLLDALNKKEKPKATIIVNSYNHSDYIAACLKSIIHQEVTFSCELIIYDDYSSDSTKEIINSIVPDLINVRKIFSEENIHSQGKKQELWQKLLGELKGDVFFKIDGDDFWTDTSASRVQIMTNTLLTNPSFSMCFSDTFKLNEGDISKSIFLLPDILKTKLSVEQLQILDYSYILLGACCFRKLDINFPPEMVLQKQSDNWWPLLWSAFGPAKYIENCGYLDYRYSSRGVWSSLDEAEKKRDKLIFACQMTSYLLKEGNIKGAQNIAHRFIPLFKNNPYFPLKSR